MTVWDKGLRNSNKELILKHFPNFTKAELDSLEKNDALKTLVNNINDTKKETKKQIIIQPVIMNLNTDDWKELSIISSDLESSDGQARQNNVTVQDNTVTQADKEWMDSLVKDTVM